MRLRQLSPIVLALACLTLHAAQASPELYEAIDANDADRMAELISGGADVNAPITGNESFTPLSLAATLARTDIVDQLIAAGADPQIAGANGTTPLQGAISSGALEIINALLSQGVGVTDADVKTASDFARPALVAVLEDAQDGGAPPFAMDASRIVPSNSPMMVTALQIRLAILGYYRGEYGGQLDEATQSALAWFNTEAHGAADTSVLAETLVALHRSALIDCETLTFVAETNLFWSHGEMYRSGCTQGSGAGSAFVTAITEISTGLIAPHAVSCGKRDERPELPDATRYANPWRSTEGEFEVGNIRVDGCMSMGGPGFLIGSGSTVTIVDGG